MSELKKKTPLVSRTSKLTSCGGGDVVFVCSESDYPSCPVHPLQQRQNNTVKCHLQAAVVCTGDNTQTVFALRYIYRCSVVECGLSIIFHHKRESEAKIGFGY